MVKNDSKAPSRGEDKKSSFVRAVKPKTNTIVRGKNDKAKHAPKILVPVKNPDLSESQNRRQFHLEKKLRRKSSFDVIKSVNKFYADLLIASREAPKGNFKKIGRCTPETIRICGEVIKLIKDNIVNHANHRSISRAIQAIVSFGDEKQRNYVMNALVPNFIQLSQLLHGSRLCCKLLACSDRKDLNRYLDAMTKDFKTAQEMFFHRYGVLVWDKLGDLDIRPSQLRKMLYKVILPKSIWFNRPELIESNYPQLYAALNEEQKTELQTYLGKLLDRIFDKQLESSSTCHIIMHYYMMFATEAHAADLLSKLEDNENAHSALLSTREGAEVLCKLLGYASAKQKKKFAKAIKDAAVDVACNKHVNIVFLRLLSTMDDTKQLKDSTITEMVKSDVLPTLVCDKFGSKTILAVLNPSNLKRYITNQDKELLDLPAPASKKEPAKRREEIIEPLMKALDALFNEESAEDEHLNGGFEEDMEENDEFFSARKDDEDMDVEEGEQEEEQEEAEDEEQEDGSEDSEESSSSSSSDDDEEASESESEQEVEEIPEEEEEEGKEDKGQVASKVKEEENPLPKSVLDFAAHEIASPVLVEFLHAADYPEAIVERLFSQFAVAVHAKLPTVLDSLIVKTSFNRIIAESASKDASIAHRVISQLQTAFENNLSTLVVASPILTFLVVEILKVTLPLAESNDEIKALRSTIVTELKKASKEIDVAKNNASESKHAKGYSLLEEIVGGASKNKETAPAVVVGKKTSSKAETPSKAVASTPSKNSTPSKADTKNKKK